MVNGKIKLYNTLLSKPSIYGSFDYHTSMPEYKLPEHLVYWIEQFIPDYSGCVNIETINGLIIECHLRLNGDFQFYNDTFVKELEKLYTKKEWNYNYKFSKKHLIPIFVNKTFNKTINKREIINLCNKYKAISIYFDNINSICQSEYLSRIFIFDIQDLERGLELKKKIIKLINL